ncbi:uncharacterized protein LOC144442821 [Glandiceps talaboti]
MENGIYPKIDPSGILDGIRQGENGDKIGDEIDGPVDRPMPYLWPGNGHSIKLGSTSGLFLRVRNKTLKKGYQLVDVNGPSAGEKSSKALFKFFHDDRNFPEDTQRNEQQDSPPSDSFNVLLGVPGDRVNQKYKGKIFILRTWQTEGTKYKTLVAEEFEGDDNVSGLMLIQQIKAKHENPLKYRFQLEYRESQDAFYIHDYDDWTYNGETHYHYLFWHKDGSLSRRKKLPHQREPNPNLRFLMKNYRDESDVTDFA